MEQYDLAVQDCRTALALDTNYSKAYGRMGSIFIWFLHFIYCSSYFSVALFCQHRYPQAVEAYKKALENDPNNETYKNNLRIAEEKLQETQQPNGHQGPGVYFCNVNRKNKK